MSATKSIIQKFGGLTAMSTALGHTNPTTVQGWQDRDSIPSGRIPEVIEAAKTKGIELDYAEFFEPKAA